MSFRKCGTAETAIGMLYYITDTDGTGGRLKARAEDFVVKEISSPPEPSKDGKYTIAAVTAKNWETNRMVRMMSRQMGISRERIGFAGTKDKRAVTTQLMSFEAPPQLLDRIDLKDISIDGVYTAKRKLQIGDLIGNEFEINVTGTGKTQHEIEILCGETVSQLEQNKGFPNYFGVQRFGAVRPITHRVGELIVRGDFEGAVRCYITEPAGEESTDKMAADARRMLRENSDWTDMPKLIPDSMAFEKGLVSYLNDHPDDWVGAIATLPTNLQMMFVHAYQSYLFNLILSERIAKGLPLDRPVAGDIIIPLDANGIPHHENPVLTTSKNIDLAERQVKLGKAFVSAVLYGSKSVLAEGEMGNIERKVLGDHHIKAEDFIVPGLSHCSSEGSYREILCPVSDLGYEASQGSYRVSFRLPKGNYATCLMREFMKSEMTDY